MTHLPGLIPLAHRLAAATDPGLTTQQVEAWFTPFAYIVYLGLMIAGAVIYYQWSWTNKCRDFIKVIVVRGDSDTSVSYAPKEGSSVSITNPKTHVTRTWPVNKLATMQLWYPGDGVIPLYLQKKITTVIVDEEDWEPLLNRNAYISNVASPDVVELINDIANSENTDDATSADLKELADGLATAPTREMIGSPALLGNIMHEKISELAVTVVKDVVDPLVKAITKLNKLVSPMMFIVGIGLLGLLIGGCIYLVYTQAQTIMEMRDSLELIQRALGITVNTTTGVK